LQLLQLAQLLLRHARFARTGLERPLGVMQRLKQPAPGRLLRGRHCPAAAPLIPAVR